MRRTNSPFLAAAELLVGKVLLALVVTPCLAAGVSAARRPHYGGTLRVELRTRIPSLDPRIMTFDASGATDRVASLIFERLVRPGDDGRPQPQLALSWQHDVEAKQWQFRLRPGVRFHDGTFLTPVAVAAAWQELLGAGRQVRASGEWLEIQSETPMPDLLGELAQGRFLVFHLAADGSPVGTGAFRIAAWQPGSRLVLAANEDCWAGRPFLDSIEIEMGRARREQLVDLELGKADLVELAPDQMRRAMESGAGTSASAPVDLLALVFGSDRPATQDLHLRQALALSIDRASILNVLLHRQGEVAGGLLPQWLSGYAFLFSGTPDLERAKALRAQVPAASSLTLVYDGTDAEAVAMAARIAVNAREVGIALQVSGQASGSAGAYDLRLVRLRLPSTGPHLALAMLLAALDLQGAPPLGSTPEQLYAAERAAIDTYRVIPLVHLAETYGLGAHVRNWVAPRWGGWRLDDVWLDTSAQAVAGEEKP